MADEKQSQRMKLKVLELKERQPVGDKGAVKLAFKATIDDNKAFWFFTFSSRLFETIESSVGKEIDAEVIISERVYDENTYIDRKVTQIYIGGQAVGGSKGGGGYNKRDEDRTDARCAAMEIGSCWREGKLEDSDSLVSEYKTWLAGAIKVKPSAQGPTLESKAAIKQGKSADEDFAALGNASQNADSPIDIDWLKESLKTIHWKQETARTWIKSQWPDIDITKDVLPQLNQEQKGIFVKKIQELLEVA